MNWVKYCRTFTQDIFQRYEVRGGKVGDDPENMKKFFLSENTVKAAKELVYSKQQHELSLENMTLEDVGEELIEMKRDIAGVKAKVGEMDENLKTILDIMMSRHGVVQRVDARRSSLKP